MIALPGLCLVTGRYDDARKILRAFAGYVSEGMLPNRFPDEGEDPAYNTVDATLWFFVAIYKYLQYTDDLPFVATELLPVLDDIVKWHDKGTRYGIRVDDDGLLTAGAEGEQLTWMDAKVFDWVVTPRAGKAVEINALWYNALMILGELFKRNGGADKAAAYATRAKAVRKRFERVFWNDKNHCLFDYVEGTTRDDAIRPNQVFALSLPFPLLGGKKARQIMDVVKRDLLTPMGLRSLSPQSRDYHPHYGGDQLARDGAYHQGTVWGWLIGPYVTALVSVRGSGARKEARKILEQFMPHLETAGIGSISEIFDAEEPFAPRGCVAQAWSVAEVLRAYAEDVEGGE
jgi:predicted glycogen debranching enzyme